ncbi:hypothetical protein QBC47DRAFT_303526 [Echria macrotheca]|uniref:BTB domain-containing protein n=1 Tax=Echria macrotheca TaxID=438768 RepID=A0AAJ0F3T1_9PEZI|nr:hypothetical protein QBC47DRAFT_303526 [Echria macrotheca]
MDQTRPEDQIAVGAAPDEKLIVDPDGDVILAVSPVTTGTEKKSGPPRRFLASSKILKLASPVFTKMFSPSFREGAALESETCPVIQLGEEDLDAMELLLRAVHFDTDKVSKTEQTPHTLAELAILSDKYDCNRALKPWIVLWFHKFNFQEVDGIEDLDQLALGKLVLAGYLFRSSYFDLMCADVAKHLVKTFLLSWDEEPRITAHVPDSVIGSFKLFQLSTGPCLTTNIDSLSNEAERLRFDLRSVIEGVQVCLRGANTSFGTWKLACPICLEPRRKKDQRCGCCHEPIKSCTPEGRVGEYFDILSRFGLWPSSHRESLSAHKIAAKMSDISEEGVKDHRCNAGELCPLISEMTLLKARGVDILEEDTEISFSGT